MPMISGEQLGVALTEAMARKHVGPKEVAEHFGVKPPSVKDWQKRGCIHKKHLGKLVAYFADVVEPSHWGADPQELAAFAPRIMGGSSARVVTLRRVADGYVSEEVDPLHPPMGVLSFQGQSVDVTLFPMAPVVAWARLGDDLLKANQEWQAGDLKAVPTTRDVSDKVKWLPVADDALAPKILPGDLIAIDPEGQPQRDEIALFKTPEGSYMLRRWRPLPGGGFEAFDALGRALDSERHGLQCVGACVGLFQEKP